MPEVLGNVFGCAAGSRAEAHQAVLEQARGALLGRVARLPTPALLALLEASFPFVGIPELRGVPLAVRRDASCAALRRQIQWGAAACQGRQPLCAAGCIACYVRCEPR
jgi:hypothetical protein